jgi:uncharacterized membrane protein YraQ (UPF0718 family)
MQAQAHADQDTRRTLRSVVLGLGGLALVIIVFSIALRSNADPVTVLKIFATRFLGIFIEAVPFLLLGSLASGLIEAFISREDVLRWIPRNRVMATFVGAFMGFAFPVCECGVVPVVRRLYKKGLPLSVGVTFLLGAPFMNPIVIMSTYIAFWQIAPAIVIGRFILTAIVAVSVGLIFAFAARPQDILRPSTLLPVMGGSAEAVLVKPARKSLRVGGMEALRVASDEFFEMGRYLIIGSVLAATMQTVFSQDALLSVGKGPVVSVLVMLALAFILSICSTVDAFLALAFFGTFTTGSLLAFLTFGPMVDIKSMLMFLGVFKRRTVAYLILLPLLMTLLAGIWINLYLRY